MEEENSNEVPFDMAKETLKSIRDWINKITELSVGIISGQRIDQNEMIVLKTKMVRQLIVLGSPLFKEKDKEEIEDFFKKIKNKIGDIKNNTGIHRNVIIYSSEADYNLDECVKGIQQSLKKYFTPKYNPGELL